MTSRALGLMTLLVFARPLTAQRFLAIDNAVREGIDAGIYPGAVVVIGRGDSVLYSRGYGGYTWGAPTKTPDPATTLWDLASISKVVGTTSATAVLVDRGRLDLDAKVSHYLPEFKGPGKDAVTLRMLLDHTSGMPSYDRLWLSAKTPAQARAHLFSIPLERKRKYTERSTVITQCNAGRHHRGTHHRTTTRCGRRLRRLHSPRHAYHAIQPSGRRSSTRACTDLDISREAGRWRRQRRKRAHSRRCVGPCRTVLHRPGPGTLRAVVDAAAIPPSPPSRWLTKPTLLEILQPLCQPVDRVLGWDHAGCTYTSRPHPSSGAAQLSRRWDTRDGPGIPKPWGSIPLQNILRGLLSANRILRRARRKSSSQPSEGNPRRVSVMRHAVRWLAARGNSVTEEGPDARVHPLRSPVWLPDEFEIH